MRVLMYALPLCLLVTEATAFAQFPFGLGTPRPARKAETQPAEGKEGGCKLSEGKRQGSSVAGNILGGLAGRAFGGRAGAVTQFVPLNTFTTMLTDAIACQLDKEEQKKAVAATEEAVKGGVGTRSTWTSATRKGVSGSSVVTAANTRADGRSCMTVDDVVIVEGEETTVSKQMCRSPGGQYVLSA